MRKLKLLLASFALLVGGVNHAFAYGWSDSDGVAVGAGEYYLYNVGAQRFLTNGCWWGTHMSTDGAGKVITISGSADAYNMHMAGIDAAKWLSGSEFVDTPVADEKTVSTDDNIMWTFTLVDGTSNTYTIKNNSNNKYLHSNEDTQYNTGHCVLMGDAVGGNTYYWILIPKENRETITGAATVYPIDATHLVTNPDGEWYIRNENDAWKEYTHGGWSGNFSHNSSNESSYFASFYEIWVGEWNSSNGAKVGNNYHLNDFDEYNNITNLPSGKYRITMTAGAVQQGDAEEITGAYIYANSEQTSISSRSNYNVECTITDGTIKAGVKTVSTTANWVSFDNLRLTYVDPYLSAIATTLPSAGGSMTANVWYKFTVASSGDYDFSPIANIVYTTDGDQLKSEPTTSALTSTMALEMGTTYYIMSTVAQDLTITPKAYTYVVGTPTSDKTYIQKDQVVTIAYEDLATNNAGAVLTKDFSGVTFGGAAIAVTPTANGFTFTVPTVNKGTSYTLSIPANAIGYETGSTFNSTNDIVLNTPQVFDGYYYLKEANHSKYLSRGAWGNVQAIIDEYGLPIRVTTNAEGITNFIYIDSWQYLNADPDGEWGELYTEGQANDDVAFSIEATGSSGYYKIVNRNNSKETADRPLYINSNDFWEPYTEWDGFYRVKATRANNDALAYWQFKTPAEHQADMQGLKDAQARAAATSAGFYVSSKTGLETELAANFTANDITITGTGGSIRESYQEGGTDDWADPQPLQVFGKETVENLVPGLYRLRVKAFERITWLGDVLAAGGAAGISYVYANDKKTQLCSVADTYKEGSAWSGGTPADESKPEGYYVNNLTSAQAAFDAGNYINDVYVYVAANPGETTGTLTFGIRKPHRYGNDNSRGAWICFNNFELTRFDQISENVTIGEGGFATYVSDYDLDYSNVEGIKAYRAIIHNNAIRFSSVTEVPQGEGVLLKGAAGNYLIPHRSTTSWLDAYNVFVRGTNAAVHTTDGSYHNYILSKKGGVVGFYQAAGKIVPTNRAYIQSNGAASRLDMVFDDDETTGIKAMDNGQLTIDNAFYDLQGRRVEAPTKGLYIMGGKKVIFK